MISVPAMTPPATISVISFAVRLGPIGVFRGNVAIFLLLNMTVISMSYEVF
jgi:hypothetical protein